MFFPPVWDKVFLGQKISMLTMDTCRLCMLRHYIAVGTGCPSDWDWQHSLHQLHCFSSISSYLLYTSLDFPGSFSPIYMYTDLFKAFTLAVGALLFSSNFNFLLSCSLLCYYMPLLIYSIQFWSDPHYQFLHHGSCHLLPHHQPPVATEICSIIPIQMFSLPSDF